jgi:pyruvate dehydrogenase E2 component (dihydrolipoamide acetyltransferase)
MVFEFKFPDVGEGVTEGEIVSWKVKEGDVVKEDQILGEVETSKAIVEMPSPHSGKIMKLHAKVGETIKVGSTLITFGDGDIPTPPKTMKAETKEKQVANLNEEKAVSKEETPIKQSEETLALPGTRKLAEELKVDLTKIKGSGIKGRITDDDVKKAAEQNTTKEETITKAGVSFDKFGRMMRLPLKGIRKTIAERMTEAYQTIPHVVAMDEFDVTELAKLRKEKKEYAENKGIKLTFLPFIMKACVIALKEHPYLNATIDEEQGIITIKEYYNVGFAYDAPQGLMVPVIHHTDNESVMSIAKKIEVLVAHIKNKDIHIEDLKGSTFTVTNYGSIGTSFGTPIINKPNVAILGLGRIVDKPWVVDGKVEIRKILPISLAFDHRVVDGAEAARFINDLKEHLEDPRLLLLDAF